MTKQLMKTIGGYAVTYHEGYKNNKFVVTDNGKVINRYADYKSAAIFVISLQDFSKPF